MLTWGNLVGRYSSNELRVWFEWIIALPVAASARNELRRPQVFAVVAGAMSLGFIAIIRSLIKAAR